jgi:alginate O-acetyltransferase complex protein AlgI
VLVLFNSIVFWVFLGAVLILHAPGDHRSRNLVLLAASYVFYAFWDWRFLGLILFSTIVDYSAGLAIGRSRSRRRRKVFLLMSIVSNLGLLGFFKYFDFFSLQFGALLNTIGVAHSPLILGLILPVGISFYTFQTMSYTIDVYRGSTEPTRRFTDFALYVSFFPQLVAGPIERSSRLLPQVIHPRPRSWALMREGAYLVLHGLFLKVVVADNMAAIANAVFSSEPGLLTGPEVLAGVYAFAFQIYGDFAGYTSIARGVARWLGFDLMLNFRMPYLAVSPSDFWQRWHISLSTWLRDYLYIPLGGNRGPVSTTYRNLMITMVLGGLWHGAAWTFVAWGAYQGFILILYRFFENVSHRVRLVTSGNFGALERIFTVVVMFHLASVGWLFFRAASLEQVSAMAIRVLAAPAITPVAVGMLATIAFFVVPLLVYEIWLERKQDNDALLRGGPFLRGAVYAYAILMLLFFPAPDHYEFIYFQF